MYLAPCQTSTAGLQKHLTVLIQHLFLQKFPSKMFDRALSLTISIKSGFLSYPQMKFKMMVGLLSDWSLVSMSKICQNIKLGISLIPSSDVKWNFLTFLWFVKINSYDIATFNNLIVRTFNFRDFKFNFYEKWNSRHFLPATISVIKVE